MKEKLTGEELDPSRVQGMKYLQRVFGLLEPLAASGCERDSAGNRRLMFSQYAGLMLLSLFNPTLQSLRGLSQASDLKKVQKLLGGGRASLGSLSESVRVFDPELLVPIIEDLLAQVPASPRGKTFSHIPDELVRRLVAVDGSALRALPQVVAAAGGNGKWRLHLQFEVWNGIPGSAEITPDETGGEADERRVLARHLKPGKMYLADRGYERYALFEEIVQARSDYLIRVQERPVELLQSLPVSAEAKQAGVVRDELVQPGHSRGDVGRITHQVRRLVIDGGQRTPSWKGHERRQEVVLLTNLIDVPAEILAAVYRLRWQIELFFRFFKQVLGCRSLFSTRPEGAAIQVYCALIAALLLTLVVGRSVGRRGFELTCLYLQGWADEDELLAGLQKLAAAKKQRN